MEKSDLTKMERWEVSRKQGKKFLKSKKFKESQPLTEEQLEKLPKLPKDWKWVSHSEIAIINPPKPNGDESLEISFLPMPAVEEETGKYSLSETRKLGEVRKGYTGFVQGDVIFAKITPCMENGKVAYLEKLINGIGFGSTEFHVSRPTPSVFGKYLFYYLVQQTFRKEAKRNMTGSAGQLRVPSSYFAEQPFPLAPLPEQRAIVSKIEQLFSELDNGISNLKLAQEQLKVYRQAVLKKAFEGSVKVPFSNLVKSSQNGISKRSGKEGNEFKVLRLADISNLEIDYSSPRCIRLTSSEISKYKLFKDDLVCIRVNGSKNLVGRLIITSKKDDSNNWAFCDHFIRFSLDPSSAVPKYYYYYFQTMEVRQYIHENMVSSAGQNTVSQGTIKSILVPLCSIFEQQAIVQEIETRLSVCDKIEQDIETNLEKAEALRQSILKKAFEGKLLNEKELAEVRGAEDWEPAEVLLERIKAEKAGNSNKEKHPTEKMKSIIQEDKGIIQQAILQAFEQVDK